MRAFQYAIPALACLLAFAPPAISRAPQAPRPPQAPPMMRTCGCGDGDACDCKPGRCDCAKGCACSSCPGNITPAEELRQSLGTQYGQSETRRFFVRPRRGSSGGRSSGGGSCST